MQFTRIAFALIGGATLFASCLLAEKAQPSQGTGDNMAAGSGTREASAPLPRVGVLAYCPVTDSAYHPNNAVNALAGDGRFGSVTLVAASQTLPSAETLKSSFDCVVAMTDMGCGIPMPDVIADSAANALAGYAGTGGGVVLTAFGFAQPRPSLGLGNAIFASGLSPLLGASIYNAFTGPLNTAAMSNAPACSKITQGVGGDMSSSFANETFLAPGATGCVSYYSSLPAVAVNEKGNVVGFNSFPAAGADQGQQNYRLLFANSVYQACTASSAITVPFDIKPASCPNAWNPASKGVLPVAILGTADLPVTKIDPESIRLSGIAPERHSYSDVATPYSPSAGKTSCDACNSANGDGLLDLELKFDSEKLAALLPRGAAANACVVKKMTGNLKPEFGGTAITGEDVVSIKGR